MTPLIIGFVFAKCKFCVIDRAINYTHALRPRKIRFPLRNIISNGVCLPVKLNGGGGTGLESKALIKQVCIVALYNWCCINLLCCKCAIQCPGCQCERFCTERPGGGGCRLACVLCPCCYEVGEFPKQFIHKLCCVRWRMSSEMES